MTTRVLFVDDEPGIRITLPLILKREGYEVETAATVPEALAQIQNGRFDVLISDLNIGEPSDGFTVVSAMRRTQPQCRTFILTGFPAFETALRAIRDQVDDYLVKPAHPAQLMESVRRAVNNERPRIIALKTGLAQVLRENSRVILDEAVVQMKKHPLLGSLALTDKQRADSLGTLLLEIADQIESEEPEEAGEPVIRTGAKHGEIRRSQGYSVPMLVDEMGIIDATTYNVIEQNLLRINLSKLITDLKAFNTQLQAQLKSSVHAFLDSEKAA